MIEIKIETTGLDKAVDLLREMPSILQKATKKSIAKSGETASQMARRSLASGGGGKWPKPHPLSKIFFTRTNSWHRGKIFGNIQGLAKFSRYSMTDKGLLTGFGTYPEQQSYNAKFNPRFMGYAKTLRGATIHVTDKMRRKMGATRWGKNATPGDNFFPLRASTKTLHIPKRLIEFDTQEIIGKFVEEMKKSFQ